MLPRGLRELTVQCRTVAMIGFIAVAASVLITGYGVAAWLWKRLEAEEPGGFERVASGVVAGVALWIAINWILAIAHVLTFTSLIIVTAVFAAAAAATLWRDRAAFRGTQLNLLKNACEFSSCGAARSCRR